jgi:hypothetical protein
MADIQADFITDWEPPKNIQPGRPNNIARTIRIEGNANFLPIPAISSPC